jgi:TolB-like protein
MRTLRNVIIPLVAVLLPVQAAAQQAQAEAPTVQVVVFPLTGFALGNRDQQQELSEAFRSMVMTELSGMKVNLVERQRLDELLQGMSMSLTGAVDDEAAIRIGRLLGADYAVTGSIVLVAGSARLDLRMFNVETGVAAHTWKSEARQDRLLTLASNVAREFAGRAVVQPKQADVVIPVAASLAYSQGLDFERRGRRQDAARMFQKALEIFPQHPHARTALRRVN